MNKGEEHKVCYFEDSFKNLEQGKKMGMKTVLVAGETLEKEGRGSQETNMFDVVLQDIGKELREVRA